MEQIFITLFTVLLGSITAWVFIFVFIYITIKKSNIKNTELHLSKHKWMKVEYK